MSNEKATSLQDLYIIVEDELRSVKSMIGYDKDKKAELEKHRKKQQEFKLSATDGCKESREYLLNWISGVLSCMKDKITPSNIDSIISLYHIDYFHNIYSQDDERLIKTPVDMEIEEYLSYAKVHITLMCPFRSCQKEVLTWQAK